MNNQPEVLDSGISRSIQKLNGICIIINSPVSLGIQTVNGYVGPDSDGNITQQDNNVTYQQIDHNKFAYISGNSPFKIILKGQDTGTFSVTINRVVDDEIVGSAKFIDIPVDLNNQITANVGNDLGLINLQVDSNGDGSIDKVVSPKVLTKEQANDIVKPLLTYSVNGVKGDNDWYRSDVAVNLSATDQGSGIDSILYSTDNNPNTTTYEKPIYISAEGIHNLWATAKDKNDNYSDPLTHTFKVDKTAPSISFNLDQFKPLNSTLNIDFTVNDAISGVRNVETKLNGTPVNQGDSILLSKLGTNELLLLLQIMQVIRKP